MRNEKDVWRTVAYAIQELCNRPQAPLSVAEQHHRYRQRRSWPDWAWGLGAGLFVSAVVAGTMLLTQAR